MPVSYPQLCIGAIVFHNDAVLLVKRKNPPNAGQWAVPGGKVKFGETLRQAVEREVKEETGLEIKAGEIVFQFEVIETDDDRNPILHYVIIDLAAEYIRGTPKAQDDALQAQWVSRTEFPKLKVNQTTKTLLQKQFSFP